MILKMSQILIIVQFPETLRKYPIIDTIFRKVSQDYLVPGTKVVLPKGSGVILPALAIHRDPEIYPEPDRFDPDRFTKENIANRHPYAWFPFGKGPRECIGMRFGYMQMRIGLVTFLNNYKISPLDSTPLKLKLKMNAQVLAPADGMKLKLTPL